MMFKKGENCEHDAVIAISPDLNHDATAMKTFLRYLDTNIFIHHPTIKHLIVWSDGCACQYKSRLPLYNISQRFGMQNIEITWNFFGSRHGKCEADGEAAVVKNHLHRIVKAESIPMKTAADVFSTLSGSIATSHQGKVGVTSTWCLQKNWSRLGRKHLCPNVCPGFPPSGLFIRCALLH